MKKLLLVAFLLVLMLLIGAACASQEEPASASSIVDGGLLYDKWWKVDSGATEPSDDNPLWASQSSNTRSGSTTWRCKECHGWDYKGIEGAYSGGSHKTGFPGVYDAGTTKTKAQLTKILNGGNNASHDLSNVLSETAISNLADFLNEGLIDNNKYINYSTKKTIGADLANGEELYGKACAACHGADGKMIMFGDDDLKALANGNPWETLHKIRFGHPGTAMPSGVKSGWSTQDSVDVLGYAQNLPELKASVSSIVTGGLLYDKWWKVDSGATEPSDDNPLWASQSSNTRSGSTTWRCKECHGWDYKGIEGAYSGGSHKTGFPGVYNTGTTKSKAELTKILNGGNNASHDLSKVLSDTAIGNLADFLNEALIDDTKYIDYSTKKTIGANLANGEKLYESTCAACHGTDGKMIMFGDDSLGTLSNGNPWETLHKIRFGQPASAMPSGEKSGWTIQDSVDVLGHSQTLPE